MCNVFIACVGFSVSAFASEAQVPLKSFKWENRIILVDNRNESAKVVEQLNTVVAELAERHLVWFVLNDDKVLTNHTRVLPESFPTDVKERYFNDGARVVLIGKDGGVKLRSDELDLTKVFGLIDSMPMRQREMRDASKK